MVDISGCPDTVADVAADAALREVYWALREHASGYRGAEVFRRAMAAHQDDRGDLLKARKALTHEFYARGIEAAARTVAELLGKPEHEIITDTAQRGISDALSLVQEAPR
jgi:hypothetical protein